VQGQGECSKQAEIAAELAAAFDGGGKKYYSILLYYEIDGWI
jgi:hypothetical protein